jgi:hypothetical protein
LTEISGPRPSAVGGSSAAAEKIDDQALAHLVKSLDGQEFRDGETPGRNLGESFFPEVPPEVLKMSVDPIRGFDRGFRSEEAEDKAEGPCDQFNSSKGK